MENLVIRLRSNREPDLDELRRDYPPELVHELFFSTKARYLFLQLGFHSIKWLISYYTWFFDECNIPLDSLLEAPGHFLTKDVRWIHPFDWVMLYMGNYEVLEFFLARNASTRLGLDDFLYIAMTPQVQRRLIEAGARPVKLQPTDGATRYYYYRQEIRAAALALLLVAKRRGDLRGIVARELWRDMAERVWAQRWSIDSSFIGRFWP